MNAPLLLLVTGTDTGVGKTWISRLLIGLLAADGLRTGAYKPVCSGARRSSAGCWVWDDVRELREACLRSLQHRWPSQLLASPENIDQMVCPQRFVAPLAPEQAARMEQRTVDPALLISGLEKWRGLVDLVVIEGAGGLLCPVTQELLVADLAAQFFCPLVIVAANRLGVVNHTLLTVAAAEARQLPIAAIILNDTSLRTAEPTDLSRDSNAQLLTDWLNDYPLFHCPFQSDCLIPLNQPADRLNWADVAAFG